MRKEDFELPEWVPQEPWNEWFEWRKKRKFPVTPRVMRHCVRMLEEHRRNGYTPEVILETALIRGWRDLWEPKDIPRKNLTKPEEIRPSMSDEDFEALRRESDALMERIRSGNLRNNRIAGR